MRGDIFVAFGVLGKWLLDAGWVFRFFVAMLYISIYIYIITSFL